MSTTLPLPSFPSPRRQIHADILVDGHRLGRVQSAHDITPAMRAHGITAGDLDRVMRGRVRVRQFRCNGVVRIIGIPVPKSPRRRPAA